ncbi:MAG: HAD family phosphatase [Syntrophotaleaceae bacterium]
MIKAIFWDNDGVLVDTEHLYFEASRDALHQVGIELNLAQFVQLTLDRGQSPLTLAARQGISDQHIEILRQHKNRRYAELLEIGAEPMPGVVETLSALHGKVVMAIVTSSRRDHFDLIHRNNGLLGYFDFILTRENYRYSKPNPAPYLKALQISGLRAEDCLVVEDTRRGLEAARLAGLRCVVLPNRLAPHNRFDNAFRVIHDLLEVKQLVLDDLESPRGPLSPS